MEVRNLSAELVDTIIVRFGTDVELSVGDKWNAGQRIFVVHSLKLIPANHKDAAHIRAKLGPATQRT